MTNQKTGYQVRMVLKNAEGGVTMTRVTIEVENAENWQDALEQAKTHMKEGEWQLLNVTRDSIEEEKDPRRDDRGTIYCKVCEATSWYKDSYLCPECGSPNTEYEPIEGGENEG